MDWLRILIICGFAYALIIAFILGWFRVGARGETPHDIVDDIAHGDCFPADLASSHSTMDKP